MLEKLIEKTLGKSPLLLKTVKTMEALAVEVRSLSEMTLSMTKTITAHQEAILELYSRQLQMQKVAKPSSVDTQLPDPNDKDKASKPN